ncbi:serine/threonine-protein kinase [Sorangium atrum]|uniref:Serine/threonine-protein kinase n=1 Tax=Sorangium atrum TaxID=2995308 RepID=A0ABT5C9Y5_9BACT|nr:serine/threonine-protein kinase [Sorangium aterium]MDC0683254.1 serine/threonine-protein kinase [Sorangium aterium]
MPPARVAAEALVGKLLCDKYRVVQLLGSGGVGHVYLAERVGRPREAATSRVALKVLRAELRDDPLLVARFEREAGAASRVRHPNVLCVDALERAGDAPCFAMELLVGLDLADTLTFTRALVPSRAVRIAADLASGVDAVHRAGVIHRDVKPENVFLVHAADGREIVKLLDFGFSCIQSQGDEGAPLPRVVGTPEYMAPEQAQGAPAAPAADVYSLGIVLYEMLAGRVPFQGPYPAIAEKHGREPPPPLHRVHPGLLISRELDAVVRKALVKDPRGRFASMAELRQALLATPEARVGTSSAVPPDAGAPPPPGVGHWGTKP